MELCSEHEIISCLVKTCSVEGNTCLHIAAADQNQALLKRYLKITEKDHQEILNKDGKSLLDLLA